MWREWFDLGPLSHDSQRWRPGEGWQQIILRKIKRIVLLKGKQICIILTLQSVKLSLYSDICAAVFCSRVFSSSSRFILCTWSMKCWVYRCRSTWHFSFYIKSESSMYLICMLETLSKAFFRASSKSCSWERRSVLFWSKASFSDETIFIVSVIWGARVKITHVFNNVISLWYYNVTFSSCFLTIEISFSRSFIFSSRHVVSLRYSPLARLSLFL